MTHLQNSSSSRINDAQFLVLASGGKKRPVPVETHGRHNVRVDVKRLEAGAGVDIPEINLE